MNSIAAHDHGEESAMMLDILVVGAGFSGMYMLHAARERGFTVRVCEAGGEVGGTWFWNRYPGARCDVESLQYSYSFSNALQQDWRWADRYAVQPEIHRYQQHVADRFDLRKDIDFHTRVVSQAYDAATRRWTVKTDTGQTYLARFCVMASGNLSQPTLPSIDGLETFKGTWYHSSRWPEKGVNFSGQRVGLIGTGATGVQMVPKIAAEADQLYVFQRTANFSVPAVNHPMSDAADRRSKRDYAAIRAAAKQTSFGMTGFEVPTQSALAVSAEERDRIYEEKWCQGGSINFLNSFNDLMTNEDANATAAEFVRRKIRAIVRDPETAAKLSPHDHPIGSKRVCLDTDYYETYNRPNVTLVDLKAEPIDRITPDGVKTQAAKYQIDALIFATGFDAMTGALLAIDIRGREGLSLGEKWQFGPLTYLGLMVAGFPNLFIVTGPGSPSVKSNMVLSIEQHVDWIVDCISYLRDNFLTEMEADAGAEQAWVAHVNDIADATLFPKADSWYLGSNIPGKPRVFMPYVGGIVAYREKCEEVRNNGYAGFSLAGGAEQQKAATETEQA